jgi:NNP family nitrate/nitrite transporter-like MFS transporter
MTTALIDQEAPAPARRRGRWIDHWEPDNERFWAQTGRRVARRNLIWSIFTEHIGFCVWLLWSIAVLKLAKAGIELSVGQVLWLTTLPNLVGSALRIPYTFAPARFGGRNWTIVSAMLLLIPCALFVYAIEHPGIPYGVLLLIAATTGLGGGNFASSMSNITHYYPSNGQGLPLGLNGAIAKKPHTIIMSILYIGTFGSFIGYSFSFGVLIKNQFPGIAAANFIWLGAFAGSVARPVGGWLADRFGGARVTMINFLLLGTGIAAVAISVDAGSWPLFLFAFLFVFVTTGIGNGSTYKMIPAIFTRHALDEVDAADPSAVGRAMATARRNAAAAIGISSAIGAFGGVLIQQTFRVSLEQTGTIGPALTGLAVFYGVCVLLTWAAYLRKVQVGSTRMSLAEAGV